MKFKLKDYQHDAVRSVLERLEEAKTAYERDDSMSSFSLTATTGAGKTVIAAAVIEALFSGGDDFAADDGAVVIWFSDDPSLNDQSRGRLLEASDKLLHSDLVTIAPPFSKPRLEPHKVYFLNTHRLGKNSLLTRGHEEDAEGAESLPGMNVAAQPDLQGWTIWETIANTIQDEDLTVYLILDEAHRGFKKSAKSDKPTIVKRLVSGHAGYPPIPVVWGISATVEHFEDEMKAADVERKRRQLDMVTVDGFRVQESGLIKDTVVLAIPNEAGNFDSVLVRMAARKLQESSVRWEEYCVGQGLATVVRPLLVLQVPNNQDDDQVGLALDTIMSEYPPLSGGAVRHVLGEHTVQKFGSWEVDHIEPQMVEDQTQVRVLVAKDAISTGWDCPRAEVLVSFRPAKDHTHITQLLGRMVRNPLARRIPNDEKLNSVECILPFFDRTTAGNVVKFLTGMIERVPDGFEPTVIQEECLLVRNPGISEAIWACWDSLPTETIPKRDASPVQRLVRLALALSQDALRPGALAEVENRFHGLLDQATTTYSAKLDKAIQEIWDVDVQAIAGRIGKPAAQLTYTEFIERADDRAIRVGFAGAERAIGAQIAGSYRDYLADQRPGDEDSTREAWVATAAIATVSEVRDLVDEESDRMATKWFAEYDGQISNLMDLRRAEYDEIRAMATVPKVSRVGRPRTRILDYLDEDNDGQTFTAELMPKHLMADKDGMCPISKLNSWEIKVVKRELARADCVGWYRNPPRQTSDSVGIAYRDEIGNWRSMHPDFIFFNEIDGAVRASIVDPHDPHLPGSMEKMQGMARFAAEHGDAFYRVEALSQANGVMKVLDLQLSAVRGAVLAAKPPPIDLYLSPVALVYDPS